jgi:hypothetical protein
VKKRILFLLCCGLVFISVLFITCSKSSSSTPVYPTGCLDSLAGNYTGSDVCSSGGITTYPCIISASNSANNITIGTMAGLTAISATLDCSKNAITIPNQNLQGNYQIYGSGTYTSKKIVINWNGLSSGIPFSCTTTYTR